MVMLHRKVGKTPGIEYLVAEHPLTFRDMSAAVVEAKQAQRAKAAALAAEEAAKAEAAAEARAATEQKKPEAKSPAGSTGGVSEGDAGGGGRGGGVLQAAAAGSGSDGGGDNDDGSIACWHILGAEGEIEGPYDRDTLTAWFEAGSVPGETLVSNNGGPWTELQEAVAAAGNGGGGGAAGGSGGGGSGADDNLEKMWFLLSGEETVGPYDGATLAAWLEAGSVDGGTYVSSDGGPWQELAAVFGVGGASAAAAEDNREGGDEGEEEEQWNLLGDDNSIVGPYPASTLKAWLEAGSIDAETMISNGGDWQGVGTVFG
eukprot:g5662.t1